MRDLHYTLNALWKSKSRALFVIIFVIAAVLRISLGIVNEEANDDHLVAARIIFNESRIPSTADCTECYNPKLYYVVTAAIFYLFSLNNPSEQIIAAQLVNVAAGLLSLIILYKFIMKMRLDKSLRLVVFSLVALNPKLIGINAQATNDTFAIFFSLAATYFLYSFFAAPAARSLLLMTASIVLAQLSKQTALPLLIAVVLIFLVKIIFSGEKIRYRNRLLASFLIFLFFIIAIVPFFGGYYGKYVAYGDPFKIAAQKDPPPSFWNESVAGPSGVTSIAQSFFTFRIFDAIKNPVITNGWEPIPKHRTSLWTQLYGRANFVHFDSWPPSWSTNSPYVLAIGRAILALALLPLFMLSLGLCCNLVSAYQGLIGKKLRYFREHEWIFPVIFAGYIAFIVFVCYKYRDYSSMKAIYIFPGLLSFVKLVSDGLKKFGTRARKNQAILYLSKIWLWVLVFLYVADVMLLIFQLA